MAGSRTATAHVAWHLTLESPRRNYGVRRPIPTTRHGLRLAHVASGRPRPPSIERLAKPDEHDRAEMVPLQVDELQRTGIAGPGKHAARHLHGDPFQVALKPQREIGP